MPTIFPGNVLTDTIYNPTGNPRFTQPDRSDVDDWGVIELVTNDNLAPEPGNIKFDFYRWFERLQMSVGTGLTLTYDEAPVLTSTGAKVVMSAGMVVMPANTSVFVYVNDTPAMVTSPTYPTIGGPVAWVTTDAASITAIEDLRDQQCHVVRVLNLPSVQSPWVAGDTKNSFRYAPEPGWLPCHGQILNKTDYPILFTAIGYNFGGSGDSFYLPDCRGRVLVGAGQGAGLSNRVIGAKGGAETVTLNTSQMPNHIHGVNENDHSHPVNEIEHNHDVNDALHSHGVNQQNHDHPIFAREDTADFGEPTFQNTAIDYGDTTSMPKTFRTGGAKAIFELIANVTGISLRPKKTNVSVLPARTNISIQAQGGGGAHENMPPYIAANAFIRVI